VQDQPEAEHAALLGLDEAIEFELNLHRITVRGQTQATRESTHVSIDGQAREIKRH
jgi:hypothetical protein